MTVFRNLPLVFVLLCCAINAAGAQSLNTPVEYMNYLTSREEELSKKYLTYMSEVAHGRRARKLEKRRQELIGAIKTAVGDANRLKPYQGDASLRDVYKSYWDILFKVFNEDYHKIVDMEEIAEQSYDNMEAYLLAQEKAGEVLDEAQAKVEPVFKAFAAKNNIILQEKETKMTKKLRQVSEVNAYYNQVFLIFFKNFKQEFYVMDAFARRDINSIEQNRNTLSRFSEEGLQKLDTMKAFKGDGSFKNACRKVLEFHQVEAEKQMPGLSDFLVRSDEFEKAKKAMDATPASKRTQKDIDNYNKFVNEYNAAVNASNQVLTTINTNSKKVLDNWEIARKNFMERHVPKN
jgi:hypothetical protein